MFDKLLEESVAEAEALTETIGYEGDPQASPTMIGIALAKTIRSIPVDAILVALVFGWVITDKSISWWAAA